ncbi:MAG TPA: adenylate kinase [Candidatus Dormibacteraeota bacterium]|nr:adenylate kinase [Candidatus Dormibacteraeota bacterium]
MNLRLILFGAPGSGKGTQGPFLADKFSIPQVSTGEILRENVRNGTDLGVVAQGYMSMGDLVPDDVIVNMVRERISQPDAANGFILDGFPRTVPQAEALDGMLKELDAPLLSVIYLEVAPDVLEKRLGGRWTCPKDGRVYSEVELGDRRNCEDDDEPLEQRDDDQPEAVTRRIQVFNEQTAPVLDYYRPQGKVLRFDGERSVEEVREEIVAKLDEVSKQ